MKASCTHDDSETLQLASARKLLLTSRRLDRRVLELVATVMGFNSLDTALEYSPSLHSLVDMDPVDVMSTAIHKGDYSTLYLQLRLYPTCIGSVIKELHLRPSFITYILDDFDVVLTLKDAANLLINTDLRLYTTDIVRSVLSKTDFSSGDTEEALDLLTLVDYHSNSDEFTRLLDELLEYYPDIYSAMSKYYPLRISSLYIYLSGESVEELESRGSNVYRGSLTDLSLDVLSFYTRETPSDERIFYMLHNIGYRITYKTILNALYYGNERVYSVVLREGYNIRLIVDDLVSLNDVESMKRLKTLLEDNGIDVPLPSYYIDISSDMKEVLGL